MIKRNKDVIKLIFQYTILFFLISFFIYFGFLKLGKSFIWNIDGIQQHYLMFYNYNLYLRNIISNPFKTVSTFSWNIGLGSDLLGQYSYYILGDLFFYISLLFPVKYLPLAYSFLIIFRLYCAGLSFMYFCKFKKINNFNTLLGMLIYTFSSFCLVAGVRHPYFLNAMVFFPLALIAVEKLLISDKKSFFILVFFAIIMNNFYFAYMILILSFLYGVIIYISEYRHENFKFLFNKLKKIAFCYITSFFMSAILFVPAVYTFFNSSRTATYYLFSYPINYYKKLLTGVVTTDNVFWSCIGVVSLIIPFMSLLILNNKKNRKMFIVFVGVILLLLHPFGGSLLNGLSFPSNRWSFAVCFLFTYIIVKFLKSDFSYKKFEIFSMILSTIVYTVLILLFATKKTESIISLSFAVLFILLIIISKVIKRKINYKYLILLFVVLNLMFTGKYLFSTRYGKNYISEFVDYDKISAHYETVSNSIEKYDDAIEKIKQEDKEFYRISRYPQWLQNLSLYHEYKSIPSYLSLSSGNVGNLANSLANIDSTTSNTTREFNGRTRITTLLGVKYFILDNSNIDRLPYGYSLYANIANTNTSIYKNDNYLSPLVFYDAYYKKSNYELNSYADREQALLETAVVNDNDVDLLTLEKEYTGVRNKAKSIDYETGTTIINDKVFTSTSSNKKIQLKVSDIEDSEIYVLIKNLKYRPFKENDGKNYSIKFKRQNISITKSFEDPNLSPYYYEMPDLFVNLGYVKQYDGEIEILFEKAGNYTFDSIEIIAVDMSEYQKAVNNLKDNQIKEYNYSDNTIKAEATFLKDGILQLATPYSDGWKAFIDGKEVNTLKINEGLIGINVTKGKHSIYFKYETPYLNIAKAFSVIGCGLFIIVVFCERKEGTGR